MGMLFHWGEQHQCGPNLGIFEIGKSPGLSLSYKLNQQYDEDDNQESSRQMQQKNHLPGEPEVCLHPWSLRAPTVARLATLSDDGAWRAACNFHTRSNTFSRSKDSKDKWSKFQTVNLQVHFKKQIINTVGAGHDNLGIWAHVSWSHPTSSLCFLSPKNCLLSQKMIWKDGRKLAYWFPSTLEAKSSTHTHGHVSDDGMWN